MSFDTFKLAGWQNLKGKGQRIMKENGKNYLFAGSIFITGFVSWTILVQKVDVQPLGVHGTDIGFATINCLFYELTGVHMLLYFITDWLGLIPIFVCMIFGGIGFVQLVRRSLFKVDYDIIILGIYYVLVIFGYLIFEMIPINYRPVLIEGFLESSYPSSTTLLVLCVMPTAIEQMNRRSGNATAKKIVKVLSTCFSTFMVLGRLFSGVHWLTDIVGSVMLSAGLFCIYKAVVVLCYKEEIKKEVL